MKEVCRTCGHAKDKGWNSCYCVKYGMIIGYGKIYCVSYEPEREGAEDEQNLQTDQH